MSTGTFTPTALGYEHASVSLKAVSRGCVNPQSQNFQNDGISKKLVKKSKIYIFQFRNIIFIQNTYYHMTHDP